MGVLYCLVFINGYIMMYRQRSGIAKSLAMGLYNSQGALLLPGRIDYIGSFVDGKAPVWLNSVLGWIDTKGQLSDGFAEDVTESF